jgi:nucleotide-binding universal stress UspA family protein
MFRKILVGVDGSEPALRAVYLGGTLSQTFDAQLVLVHVVQVSAIAEQAINMSATEHLKENPKNIMEKLSQEVLEKARRQANQAGVRDDHIDTITVDGDQARQLIQTAKRQNVDLIIVGSRGRGRLEGLLLGSVSQKVAALAPCPCLIV